MTMWTGPDLAFINRNWQSSQDGTVKTLSGACPNCGHQLAFHGHRGPTGAGCRTVPR